MSGLYVEPGARQRVNKLIRKDYPADRREVELVEVTPRQILKSLSLFAEACALRACFDKDTSQVSKVDWVLIAHRREDICGKLSGTRSQLDDRQRLV
jgi:hypothetical protein